MPNRTGHMLTDIKIPEPNAGLASVLMSQQLALFMERLAADAALRYKAVVAKRTGKLAASAVGTVIQGDHKHDRWCAHVTAGGELAASTWRGQPFYYGVLHEFGSPTKRDRFHPADDFEKVMATMKGAS